MLLGLLVETFVPEGDPLVVGIDEILERRYGRRKLLPRVSTVIRCALPMRISLRAAYSKVGVRDPQGGFETQALLCADLNADPQKILRWFQTFDSQRTQAND